MITRQQIEARFTVEGLSVEAGEGRVPTFRALAYAGGPFRPKMDPPIDGEIIIDLSGTSATKETLPILRDHDVGRVVGHSTRIVNDGAKLVASGLISGAGPDAAEILASAKAGFPWGVSIGATLASIQRLSAGKTVTVNGRRVSGPVNVARQARIHEISFLSLPADANSSVTIAARKKGLLMPRQNQQALAGGATNTPENGNSNTGDDTPALENIATADDANNIKERRRIISLEALLGDDKELFATAIDEGWDVGTAKVAMKARDAKAAMPRAFNIRTGRPADAPAEGAVLEASLCLRADIAPKTLEERHRVDPKVIGAAMEPRYRSIGLQELFLLSACAAGYSGFSVKSDLAGVLQAAYSVRAAGGFSTLSLPLILANTANKILLDGYMGVEQTWRQIAVARPVTDLKSTTSHRLLGGFSFEEIGPGGEIKHGEVDEQSFTNQAKTYARMFGITRTHILNDDLGALINVPRKIGRGAALKFNTVFWTTFLDDASFFVAGNNNYISGATTNLSVAGLNAALVKFRRQTGDDDEPLGIEPSVLLVPPELECTAQELLRSTTVNTGGSSTTAQVPNANAFSGRFPPAVSAYLTNTTAWYLCASPSGGVGVVECVFLNGQQQPTVENADADFNTLGIQMRGYFDFGVALQDPKAGVKSKGSA